MVARLLLIILSILGIFHFLWSGDRYSGTSDCVHIVVASMTYQISGLVFSFLVLLIQLTKFRFIKRLGLVVVCVGLHNAIVRVESIYRDNSFVGSFCGKNAPAFPTLQENLAAIFLWIAFAVLALILPKLYFQKVNKKS